MVGKIIVITGPMYSGKTTELLSFAEIYELGRKRIQVFKPAIDKRYSETEVVTHKLYKVPARVIVNSKEILENLKEETDAVFVDEVHFIDIQILEVARKITEKGIDFYCAGLDMNYLLEPFETSSKLLAVADEVIKKRAVCEICGEYNATISHKTVGNDNIFDVGGKEKYIAVCKDCYQKLMREKNEVKD